MLYGTVIEFTPSKGFGFIRADYGPDVFFHISALGACQQEPEILPGQPVKYELVPGSDRKSARKAKDADATTPAAPRRPRAQLVELIDKIPGAALEKSAESRPAKHHPRARRKKPTWRR